jgi:acetyl-CoA carboxylase biotin carboxyl carrier protein
VDRDLIETMVDVVEGSGNSEVTVEIAGARVTVRRSAAPAAVFEQAGPAAGAEQPGQDVVRVESPIVGTFYRSSSPDADPFVSEGSRVSEGDVLCLVEAMKLFNEIVAETDGVIQQIVADNEQPVEFGQLLFLIEP